MESLRALGGESYVIGDAKLRAGVPEEHRGTRSSRAPPWEGVCRPGKRQSPPRNSKSQLRKPRRAHSLKPWVQVQTTAIHSVPRARSETRGCGGKKPFLSGARRQEGDLGDSESIRRGMEDVVHVGGCMG